ncbi:MAG: hypothetical protein ACIARQ_00935 [Phycisphaerales bacterium JB061]
MKRTKYVPLLMMFAAGQAAGQLTLNEVFENPPNGGDGTWEYIELYGPPGMDLTGYAVALVKGGMDEDNDDIPDGNGNNDAPEIDEAFSLDGWTVGPNGLFILYNREDFGFTSLEPYLTVNPDFDFFLPEGPDNPRYLHAASFQVSAVPSVDIGGNLENDGSSTYLIIRRRPGHSLSPAGTSNYAPEYGWKKDVTPDVDFNSRLDFGDEHTRGVPLYFGNGLDGAQTTALTLEPVQIVDELSWSNSGGKEYNLGNRDLLSNKLTETPGFNPDAVSRVRYDSTNPLVGWTVKGGSGELDRTSLADESWIYGETLNVQPGSADYTMFKPLIEPGDDTTIGTLDDELNHMAPIDPDGPKYSYDGPGDDNPLTAPFYEYSGALDPSGTLLFEPYDITGYRITPNAFNDAPLGTPLAATAIAQQDRYVTGDFDFDGDVDCDDRDLIATAAAESWTLDDLRDDLIRDFNTDDPSDDVTYTGFARQAEVFNATLAMIRMDLTDGSTGEWTSGQVIQGGQIVAWGGSVTTADLAAFDTLLDLPDNNGNGIPDACETGRLCADVNNDGMVSPADFSAWVAAFNVNNAQLCDQNNDDLCTPADFSSWASNFNQGQTGPICP